MDKKPIETATVKQGIAGALAVEVLFSCIASSGALGISMLQLLMYFVAAMIIPAILGGIAGIGISFYVRNHQKSLAFGLGALSMCTGTGVLVVYADKLVYGTTPDARILYVYLTPLITGLAVELIVFVILHVVGAHQR